jgi:hypothetical protein
LDKYVYDFFAFNCAFTEIVFKERVEIVYFVKHPACLYLSDNEKKDILEKVDRNTRFNKMFDFQARFNRAFD